MTTYVPPKKNSAFILQLSLPSYGTLGRFQSNPTMVSGDVTISKDGGAFSNTTNLPTVTPAAGRSVQLSLTSTEMNADNIIVLFVDQTNPPEWVDTMVEIQTSAANIDDVATDVWSVGTRSLTILDEDSTMIDIDNSVWGGGTRTLTALDEDSTTLDLDTTIRAAVGLASANLDTQITGVNTNIDANEAKIDIIDTNVDAILIDTGTTLDGKIDTIDTVLDALVADIGSNGVGLTAIPWNAAWDAEVQSEVNDGLIAYDAATGTDVISITPPTVDAIADEIETRVIDANIVQVNDIVVNGVGTEANPWGP